MIKEYLCGCKFKLDTNGRIDFGVIDIENIRDDCPLAWQLIQEGKTRGVFQLEKNLGRKWAKEIKPANIEELAAVISLIRPSCLQAKIDGKSMTQWYALRKNGFSEVEYPHKCLKDILEESYGIVGLYQEHSIKIAQHICGFDLVESDILRRSIGTKDSELMAQIKPKFISKAVAKGLVNQDEAELIFELIKKGERYAFNKCIAQGTIIRTQKTSKTVEQLYEMYNRPNNCHIHNMWSLDENYKVVYNKIDTVSYEGIKDVYEILVDNYSSLKVTSNHKFPTTIGVQPLSNLKIGDDLFTYDVDKADVNTSKILDIRYAGKEKVYNISMVDNPRNYIANGIFTCNSHAIGYAIDSYWTAYCKAHFPRHFFCSYLMGASMKMKPHEEIRELTNDAHIFNINVLTPSFTTLKEDFYICGKDIRFGLGNIKGIGPSVLSEIINIQKELSHTIEDMSWLDFLVVISSYLNKTTIENLIDCGALDFTGIPRIKMKFEYGKYRDLSNKEMEWCLNKIINHSNNKKITLTELLSELASPKSLGGGCSNKNRIEIVKSMCNTIANPPFKLEDTIDYIIDNEDRTLGIPITYSKLDSAIYQSNTSCKEIINGKDGTVKLNVIIENVKIHTIKSGKNAGCDMAFLTVSDKTGILDNLVVFANVYEDIEHLLVNKSSVSICGVYDKSKDSLIVETIKSNG